MYPNLSANKVFPILGIQKGKSKWVLTVFSVVMNARKCVMSSVLVTIIIIVRYETEKQEDS